MTFKKCRNEGCEVLIEVRNTAEGWRPFEESGNKHNCQFSDYAKKQRGESRTVTSGAIGGPGAEDVNDHGNEDSTPMHKNFDRYEKWPDEKPTEDKYVDHTAPTKPQLKIKTLTDPTPEGLDLKYNNFPHPIKFSQYHPLPSLYTMVVYYEEIAGK